MLRALLFDFNGVLLDDEEVHCELFVRTLAEVGVPLTRQQYHEQLIAFDDQRAFTAAFAAAGRELGAAECTELIIRKSHAYDRWMEERGYPFFPGAVAAVRSAHQAGLRMGVVSGALRGEIESALQQEGLRELFDCVVAAEDVKESKPHPEGYLAGLRSLRQLLGEGSALEASSVAALEDTSEGLAAAQSAGLRTIGIAQTLPAAELRADWVLPNIAAFNAKTVLRRFGTEPARS